jgi:hypothetical protein
MTLRLEGDLRIENLRRHGDPLVAGLRAALAAGVHADPDPRRPGFYDVHSGRRTYFIHVSPVSGAVMLLATWCEDLVASAQGPNAITTASALTECGCPG